RALPPSSVRMTADSAQAFGLLCSSLAAKSLPFNGARGARGTMKTTLRLLALGLVVLFCSLPHAARAEPSPADDDKTLSPYCLIEGGDPAVDQLPLKDTRVEVAVAGVIADVTVRQTYENHGTRPIHAHYVFPASTRAAVHALTMTVGSERIT